MWIARVVTLVLLAASFNGLAASLRVSDEVVTAGFITLHIERTGPPRQQSTQLSIQHLSKPYSLSISLQPSQQAVTISGLADGDYLATLGDSSSNLTQTSASFSVKHHQLTLALALFALGLCLFVLLVGMIVVGNKQTHDKEGV
ncbi:hypothetical protein WLQ65_22465 [Pseudoalteromonas piscicida]|uniref:hypothetical protein n=1 Tax=Pseudoalteromonas piscicida TaxID=43662 RepID=UPI000E35CB25|nr:hypothetical protein [Pseudoalteromonas piscicida]AXQ99439.1 hypothetical protein D0N37_18085 [Pseudoalteromonas piscicida]